MEKNVSKRYSDKDLSFFKKIILEKVSSAKKDLQLLKDSYSNASDNGTDDTYSSFKSFEEAPKHYQKNQTQCLLLDKKSSLGTYRTL
jgi:DnaK suppressor protein